MTQNMVVRVPLCGFPTKEAHGPLAWAWTLSRERKVSFKAADIDDCCEWVIAIREEIASKGGK